MKKDLTFKPNISRNVKDRFFTIVSAIFATIAVLPLVLVLAYIIIKGGSQINLDLFLLVPQPPGDDLETAGGIGNAIVGTLIISSIASLISIPIGVGAGIYLAEYSKGGDFSKFIRFGTNVLSGIPSIIVGVFIYAVIVVTKILFGSMYSGMAGGFLCLF